MTDKSPNEELALLGSQICVNNAGNSVSFYSDVYVGNDVTVNTLITENTLMVGGNTIVTPSGIYLKTVFANNAKGSANQVLTSNTTGGVYWANSSAGTIKNVNQSFVGDGTKKTFVITGGYTKNDLNVFLNGVRMSTSIEVDVSSGTDIVFVNAPENDMPIDVVGILSGSSFDIDTSKPYTWSNIHTFNANVKLYSILANNFIGTAGQVLTTNGNGIYWANSSAGTLRYINQSFVGDGTTKIFTITGGYTQNDLNVFLNGVRMSSNIDVDVSSGSDIIFVNAPEDQTPIDVVGVISASSDVNVNTAAQYTWTNTHTFDANVRLDGVLANGVIGTAGQFLTTDGSKVYWSTGGGSVNTAAQYAWTNTHSFTAPNGVSFNNTDTGNGYVRVTGTNFALVSQFVNGTGIGGWFSYPDRTNIGTKDCQFIVTTAAEGYLIKYDSSNNILRNFKFPTSNGIAGQVLSTDGFGVTSWVTAGGGGGADPTKPNTWTAKQTFNGTDGSGGLAVNGSSYSIITESVGTSAIASWYSFPSYTYLGTSGGGLSVQTSGTVSVNNAGVNFTFPPSTGSSGQVLSTDGTGKTSWVSGGGGSIIPSGTKMLFAQPNAPTGWTKDTTHNDKALRVVSGTAGSGGSVPFSSALVSQAVSGSISGGSVSGTTGGTAITEAQMPSHKHTFGAIGGTSGSFTFASGTDRTYVPAVDTTFTGGGQPHSHTFSGSVSGMSFNGNALNVAYVDVLICIKD